jgi:DNA end-binding protein Ku
MAEQIAASRAYWKGAVTFGLVTVPVRLAIAAKGRDVSFNQICLEHGGPVGAKSYCKEHDEDLARDQIGRAYQVTKGEYTPVTDEELDALEEVQGQTIDVMRFVPADSIPAVQIERSYFVEPEDVGVKAYALLREAMRNEDVVALTRVVMRNRTHLAVLRIDEENRLLLQGLYWPDEIRKPGFKAPGVDLSEQELNMAQLLVHSMYAPDAKLTVEDLHDEYREALMSFIEAKAAGNAQPIEAGKAAGPAMADLMAALTASVNAAKEGAA